MHARHKRSYENYQVEVNDKVKEVTKIYEKTIQYYEQTSKLY